MNKDKKIIALVMSVGPYETKYTVRYLQKIGAGINDIIVSLPKQFKKYTESYKGKAKVFLYDEKKYINEKFEYFGFKKRNCGGIGRQGIAEAVEIMDDKNTIFLQVDDDTDSFNAKKIIEGKMKAKTITRWEEICQIVQAENNFWENTGIECMAVTGATPPKLEGFIANRKIFNNFIIRKGNRLNFDGFKALCSDDYRYNVYHNIIDCTPMITYETMNIVFHKNQGDRSDGNAPLYNKDCSWKKSFALKMMFPWCVEQKITREENRVLFRGNLQPSKLYPPISLIDSKGKIVGELR